MGGERESKEEKRFRRQINVIAALKSLGLQSAGAQISPYTVRRMVRFEKRLGVRLYPTPTAPTFQPNISAQRE